MAPLALFDLDNTLIDRAACFAAWSTQFLRSEGIDAPDAHAWLVEADGDGYTPKRELFDLVCLRFGLPHDPDDLVVRYRREYPRHATLAEEVRLALTALRHAGWRVGIVTNGSPSQEAKIRGTGLDALVDGWCISDVDRVAKPAAAHFALAAERAGGSLDDAWVVGDHPVNDIGGGRDAGCETVWLHRERTWELTAYHPHHIVTSVAEAVTLMLAPELHLPNVIAGW